MPPPPPQASIQQTDGDEVTLIPDSSTNVHSYATKKTAGKSLLNLGMLMQNVSQLKVLLSKGSSASFYDVNMTLIILSIVLQVVVGIMLFILGRMKTHSITPTANKLNNACLGFAMLISVINVLIAAFGINQE